MKTLILTITAVFLTTIASAQLVVDGLDLNQEPEVHFIKVQILEAVVFGKRACTLTIDFGQERLKNATIMEADNPKKAVNMVSIAGAINYLVNRGWEPWQFMEPAETPNGKATQIIFYKRTQN